MTGIVEVLEHNLVGPERLFWFLARNGPMDGIGIVYHLDLTAAELRAHLQKLDTRGCVKSYFTSHGVQYGAVYP